MALDFVPARSYPGHLGGDLGGDVSGRSPARVAQMRSVAAPSPSVDGCTPVLTLVGPFTMLADAPLSTFEGAAVPPKPVADVHVAAGSATSHPFSESDLGSLT